MRRWRRNDYPLRVRLRTLLVLALLALLAPATASAWTGVVEVRDQQGRLVARGTGGPFAFPRGGALVRIGAAEAARAAVTLDGVRLFGGKVRATRVVVPALGLDGARVDGLVVGERPQAAAANTLVPLGRGSYLVALQAAVAPGVRQARLGVVGLRVHVGVPVPGLPHGGEIWLGLARGIDRSSPRVRVDDIPASLLPVYRKAADEYGVPWSVLAAINRIETHFGATLGPSKAGAIGWMQFLPSTWRRWGADGDGDGKRNPDDPDDAILAAARYLAAAGASTDLARAVFAYNHDDAYVRSVLGHAAGYAGAGPGLKPAGPLDPTTPGGG